MNSLTRTFFFGLLFTTCTVSWLSAKSAQETLADRLATAEYVLEQIMENEQTRIPRELLREARGIVLLNHYRGSFIFGGQGGAGALVCRHPVTGEWGPPVFITTGGANFGLQAGVKEINTVYLLMDDESVRKAYSGRFRIGADAAAVAGPVGPTEENFPIYDEPVFVYSNSRGLFLGAAFKGGWIAPDQRSTRRFYNTRDSIPEVALGTWIQVPSAGQSLLDRIRAYEGR
ncbi:MAG: hypothetical protein EA425_04480 [Puniceicoccaceae bacterium]|nr:MAG: hypothetical protein EA425_04480 [Puniceicoccaceae bacterium]